MASFQRLNMEAHGAAKCKAGDRSLGIGMESGAWPAPSVARHIPASVRTLMTATVDSTVHR